MKHKLAITLIKSVIGRLPKHVQTVIGLFGSTKMNRRVVLEDTPCVRGMINKISYMVQVEEVTGDNNAS